MKMELAFYRALKSINVPDSEAQQIITALESDMNSLLATKSDITSLEHRLTSDITTLEHRLEHRLTSDITNLEHRLTAEIAKLNEKLTIRMAGMMSATIGIIVAALKFLN
jgi:hypothetical protein